MSGNGAASMREGDRRVQKTRAALRAAFGDLLLTRPYADFGPAEIAERADVGRSTFYEHFQGKDDLLVQSTLPILEPLAASCGGPDLGVERRLVALLDHTWENRRFVRPMLAERPQALLVRALAERIAAVLAARPGGADTGRAALAGGAVAAAQLALLGDFLSGRTGAPASELARRLQVMSRAAASALVD